ncbi:MAG: PQQ-binding-like beta-propeller repeat protein [Firmicutes bacterium]|nr:PQQ-binding-like beta-propeller repeat protein [Bacillota bacterium]
MLQYTKNKIIMMALAALLLITGCSQQIATDQGTPIEPLVPVPGAEEESVFPLGQFVVKSSDVQITDLSVTKDGSMAVVATAAKVVYLLGKDGKPLWENQQATVPLQAHIAEDGKFVAIGTEGGNFLLLNSDQTEIAAHQFNAPVTHLDVSIDGELILVGLDEEEGRNNLVVLDKKGEIVWQQQVGEIIEAKIAGANKHVIVNWLEDGTSYLAAFSAAGEKLWELKQHSLLSLDKSGKIIISAKGKEINRYDQDAQKIWDVDVSGEINRVYVADNGGYLAAIMTDPNTQRQTMLYLDTDGNKLWEMPLPVDASVLVSADGKRIFVSSWGQYQDDVTQIFIYNEWGQEVNRLEVSGRLQKMAFAAQSDTIVIALNEGNIYFLNANTQNDFTNHESEKQQLVDYYQPVAFEREQEETYLTLFFYDKNAENLIPVTRRIKKSQSLLRDCVQELIRGPAQESQLLRTIPKDAHIVVSAKDGVAQLDLPAALDEMSGSTFIQGVVESLILTVSSVPTVEKIKFTVEGENKQTFGQEGVMIGESFPVQPLGREKGETLLFVPVRSGDKYYLLPISVDYLPLKEQALAEEIIRTVLLHYKQNFGHLLLLQKVTFEKDTIYLDLHSSFNKTLLDTAAAAARAAVLRDALTLSLAENLPYSTVVITVDGQEPKSGEHYLPWVLTVKKPYYINIER